MRLRKQLPILRAHFHPEKLPLRRVESLEGTNNTVSFSRLSNTNLVIEDQDGKVITEYKDPEIVVNVIKKAIATSRKNAIAELKQHTVTTARIYRYIFNDNNHLVSLRAKSDLKEYLISTQLDSKVMKKMIGQLLVAVDNLHRHKLAHRDIKTENILVYIDKDGSVNIKLADLDTIERADKKAENLAGTIDVLPEKVKSMTPSGYMRINTNAFFKADKTELDCYAVGCVISEMLERCSCVDVQVVSIIAALKSGNPNIMSIQKAMDSTFFGVTADDRAAYFKSINAVMSEHYFFDGYYLRQFEGELDEFYMMPRQVKELYAQIERVANQLLHVKEHKRDDDYVKNAVERSVSQLKAICKAMLDDKGVACHMVSDVTNALELDLRDVGWKIGFDPKFDTLSVAAVKPSPISN